MPVYCFVCPRCAHTKELVRPIARRNDPLSCLNCLGVVAFEGGTAEEFDAHYAMIRDLCAERLGSSDLPYAVPVESNAMAMNPTQIPEFKKRHPDIEVNREGQVVLRSHRERKRVMKELGFMDRDGY